MLEIDSVVSAHDPRPPYSPETARVFREFFEVFGNPLLDESGDTASQLLLPPRILHIDDEHFPVQCIAVHNHVRRRTLFGHARKDHHGNQTHHFIYDSRDFMVASSDGTDITQWKVMSAHGVHHGKINAIDMQYDPNKEVLQFMLTHPTNRKNDMLTLKFGLVSQQGTMQLGGGNLGWILDEYTSRQRQEAILQPSQPTTFADVGHTALAS